MSKKENILNKLFSLQRFGIKPGLDRTLKLSEYIGNPHFKFPSIHVAGTNGKGSVCAMLSSIFMEAGYKVGLYTSPHLVNFNERIRINHNEISDDEMVELAETLLIGEEKWGCTFFEITTVMAFEYFARKSVDIAIIETGMGGRFDSTNILLPLLSIITSIDLDHKEYLGNTLEEIAFEKAGIIKENTAVVIAKYPVTVKNVFADKAKELNSQLINSSELCSFENHIFNPDFSQSFDLKFNNNLIRNITLGLAGKHQLGNVAEVFTAIDCLKTVIDGNKFVITEKDVRNGMINLVSNTELRGRIEPFFEVRSQLTINNSQFTIGSTADGRQQTADGSQFTIHNSQFTIGSTADGRQQTADGRQLTINNSQLTINNYKISSANSQLSTGNGQPITDNPIILDTGHNPGAIKKLVESLKLHRPDIEKWNFVYGAMADKDILENLKILKPVCDELILTRPKIDRAIDLQKLREIANEFKFKKIVTKPDVSDAVMHAIESGKPTVISGSFYLAGEALPFLEKLSMTEMLKFQS